MDVCELGSSNSHDESRHQRTRSRIVLVLWRGDQPVFINAVAWPVLPRRRARHARNRPPPSRAGARDGQRGSGARAQCGVPETGGGGAVVAGVLAYGSSVLTPLSSCPCTHQHMDDDDASSSAETRTGGCGLLCFISDDAPSVPPWRCYLIWHRHRLGFSYAVVNSLSEPTYMLFTRDPRHNAPESHRRAVY